MRDGRFSFALGDRGGVGVAAPARPTLRSVRLPLTEAAAKPLAMLRWVRPGQIVLLKLLRESRNKNLNFFATFLRLAIVMGFPNRD